MLAQGQSSSAKRGGLAAVSSGLIFLKKKKKMQNERKKKWFKKKKCAYLLSNYKNSSQGKHQASTQRNVPKDITEAFPKLLSFKPQVRGLRYIHMPPYYFLSLLNDSAYLVK